MPIDLLPDIANYLPDGSVVDDETSRTRHHNKITNDSINVYKNNNQDPGLIRDSANVMSYAGRHDFPGNYQVDNINVDKPAQQDYNLKFRDLLPEVNNLESEET